MAGIGKVGAGGIGDLVKAGAAILEGKSAGGSIKGLASFAGLSPNMLPKMDGIASRFRNSLPPSMKEGMSLASQFVPPSMKPFLGQPKPEGGEHEAASHDIGASSGEAHGLAQAASGGGGLMAAAEKLAVGGGAAYMKHTPLGMLLRHSGIGRKVTGFIAPLIAKPLGMIANNPLVDMALQKAGPYGLAAAAALKVGSQLSTDRVSQGAE